MSAEPTFGTVLVRRKANERPAEWELRLRPVCSKVRVVEKLLGGAHLVVTGSPSVAARIYGVEDFDRLEGAADDGAAADDDDDGDGIDGLRGFRDSYEHSMVLFVLPTGRHQRDQLGRRDSFVNVAQKSLLRRTVAGGEEGDGKSKRTTRTAIASDAPQIIHAIGSFVQALAPEKREKRRKYFAQVAERNFLPGTRPAAREVVANHVSKTFREWADRRELPEGDADVLLSMLGSLGGVVTADATAL
ncbi:hypothetical protein ACHAWF_010663, partial [Thalassiosira exigua]